MAKLIPLAVAPPSAAPQPASLDAVPEARLTRYLKTLGEAHRLRIFRMLLQSELCVCELEERLGIASSLLAHHLKVCKEAGLIQVRRGIRDARWLYYSVNPRAYAELRAWVGEALPAAGLPPAAQCGSNCNCG